MATDKQLSVMTALAASISIAALAGCPSAPTAPAGVTPLTPVTQAPITPITPGGEEPTKPEEPTEPAEPQQTPSPSDSPTVPHPTDKTPVAGIVYDDAATRLDQATITAKALGGGKFANGTDTLTVTSQQGAYTLEGCPVDGTIQVTASKTGYTTRMQTIVPKHVVPGAINPNVLHFGDTTTDPGLIYALSNKPEVVSATPASAGTGISPATTFTLTFHTPVTTADVEANFAIYASGTAGQSQALSLPDVALTNRYDGGKDIGGAGNGLGSVIPDASKFIYDASSMTASWSESNKKVTFTFKPGAKLPTDKDATKLPKYAMSFKGGAIRDASGVNGRTDQWFRLSPVQANRVGSAFTVAADTTAPKLMGVTATNKADDAGQNGGDPDVILATFSEPMALFPGDQGGRPIPRNASGGGYALLGNIFKYYVSSLNTSNLPNGTSTLPGGFSFDNLNSATTGFLPLAQNSAPAIWATSDQTYATVQLVPLSNSVNGSGTGWSPDVAAAGSTTSSLKVVNSVAGLNVGDLLQDQTTNATGTSAAYRVTGIDAANKTVTVDQYGGGSVPAAGHALRYWATTTAGSASNGATNLMLTGLSGLQKGDTLRITLQFGPAQVVTLTANPGANSISFAPGLTGTVASGASVSYISPTTTIHTGFASGYSVWTAVSPAVMDPAGNALDTTSNGNIKKGIVP
jgi:hypothetical protein